MAGIPLLVVGTGFGCRIQVPSLRAAGFDVVGLVGANAARTVERAKLNRVPQAFTDLDEAITKTGAVAVAISTPPHTHADLALTAIGRGCHLICEKPFAKDMTEARKMLDAANRSGGAHLTGFEFRWLPERAMVARMIARGDIGTPRLISLARFIPMLADPAAEMPDWWFDAGQGGGWLGAWGSHVSDWVRTWVGEFESVSAALLSVSARRGGAEDTYVVRFRMKNGVEGILQQTSAAWGSIADMNRVAGTDGTVWVNFDGTIWLADRKGERQIEIDKDLLLPPPPPGSEDPRMQQMDWQMMAAIELTPYMKLGEVWRDLINGRAPSQTVAIPTFADAVASMAVLDAIRSSAAQGGALVKVAA